MSIKIIKTDDVDMFMQSDDFKEFQNQCDEYTKQVLKNALMDYLKQSKPSFCVGITIKCQMIFGKHALKNLHQRFYMQYVEAWGESQTTYKVKS